VLDVLRAKSAPATFFINTANFFPPVVNNPDHQALILRMHFEGSRPSLPLLTLAKAACGLQGMRSARTRRTTCTCPC
jgi:hypothetical protein